MVHGILDAAMVLLAREGAEGFTTNRLAEMGGVSVGSIYQYFANRDVIIAAVIERGVIYAERTMRDALAAMAAFPPDQVIRRILTVVLTSLEPHGDMLNEVLATTTVFSGTGLGSLLETRISDLLRDLFGSYSDRYVARGGTAGIYVVANGVIYAVLKWLSERPPHVSREELIESLVAHFNLLIAERPKAELVAT